MWLFKVTTNGFSIKILKEPLAVGRRFSISAFSPVAIRPSQKAHFLEQISLCCCKCCVAHVAHAGHSAFHCFLRQTALTATVWVSPCFAHGSPSTMKSALPILLSHFSPPSCRRGRNKGAKEKGSNSLLILLPSPLLMALKKKVMASSPLGKRQLQHTSACHLPGTNSLWG